MRQKPFTAPQLAALQRNAKERPEDPVPVVKFFAPWGSATWLFTELADDGDTLFGLCDIGHGSPELGYASLAELRSLRGPWGLTIERDIHFSPGSKTLAQYADEARAAQRIVA